MLVKKSTGVNRLRPLGHLQTFDENGWAPNGLTDKHRTVKIKGMGMGVKPNNGRKIVWNICWPSSGFLIEDVFCWFGLSPIRLMNRFYSPVAQLVEQVAVNHLVGGSSPSRGANKSNDLRHQAKSLHFLEIPFIHSHKKPSIESVWKSLNRGRNGYQPRQLRTLKSGCGVFYSEDDLSKRGV